MSKSTATSFTNSVGRVITTHNAVDAEKYRNHPGFTELTDTAAKQVEAQDHLLDYDGWTKPKLEAEIEARNDAAGDGEPQISVDAPGNKPELIAALQADDARRTS